MMKSQNGLTLVSLIITVVIMTILLTVTVNTSTSLITNSKLRSLVTTMYLVQAKLDILYEKYEFDNSTELIGTEVDLEEMKNYIEKEESESEEEYEKRLKNWYEWDEEILNSQGIQTDDFKSFCVHYADDLEIVYPDGFSINQKKIYKLSELREKDVEDTEDAE